MSPSQVGAVDDEPSSPLQNASKLLSDMNAEMQLNMSGVDSMNEAPKAGVVSTPAMDPNSRNGSIRPTTTAPANQALVYPKMAGDLEQVVYPVGATNGIDPMYSEHINNVPYPMPAKQEIDNSDARRQFADNRKKSTNVDPRWFGARRSSWLRTILLAARLVANSSILSTVSLIARYVSFVVGRRGGDFANQFDSSMVWKLSTKSRAARSTILF